MIYNDFNTLLTQLTQQLQIHQQTSGTVGFQTHIIEMTYYIVRDRSAAVSQAIIKQNLIY